MFGLPSFGTIKKFGVWGAIIAAIGYFVGGFEGLQGIFNSLLGSKEAEASTNPAANVPGVKNGQSAATTTEPQTQQGQPTQQTQQAQQAPVQMPAPQEMMASWKQDMEAQKVPESVRLAITAKEAEILEKFKAAKTPQEIQQIKLANYLEATKPQFDAFMKAAENQVTAKMNQMIQTVSQDPNVPDKEKMAALKTLQAEKRAAIADLKGQFENMPMEERIALALSKDRQGQILKHQADVLTVRQEEVSKNVSAIARQNNGLAWGGSALGWTSAGLALGGLIAVPFTGGASLIPLGLTLAACGTGMAAGACKVINNSDKHGSNFDWGMGIAEIGLNAIPMGGVAVKSAGLFATSAVKTAATSATFLEKTAAWVPGLSKATIAEGQAITAVSRAEKTINTALKTTVNYGATVPEAQQIMTQVTTGAMNPTILKKGTDIVGLGLTGTKGATSSAVKLNEAGKLAGQAVLEHKFYDPLVGSTPSAIRAFTELGYTTMDDTVNKIIPNKTPENPGQTNSPAKLTLAP